MSDPLQIRSFKSRIRTPWRFRLKVRWNRLRYRMRHGKDALALRDQVAADFAREMDRQMLFGTPPPPVPNLGRPEIRGKS